MNLLCGNCGSDLEKWLGGQYLRMVHCPVCGDVLTEAHSKESLRMTSCAEIDDMIRGRLVEVLETYDRLQASTLPDSAWESEAVSEAFFCSNYKAARFVIRHSNWVDGALDYACFICGDRERYVTMLYENCDQFITIAFMYATEHYLREQIGLDVDEGDLTGERRVELVNKIRSTEYEGGHWGC